MALAAPALEDRHPWAATPWPPVVVAIVAIGFHSYRKVRRELADAGVATAAARKISRRALRTGRLPEDRTHDDEIRAYVRHVRLRYADFNRRSWVIVLVLGASSAIRGLTQADAINLAFAALTLPMALLLWWGAPRTAAKQDRLETTLDARRADVPPAPGA